MTDNVILTPIHGGAIELILQAWLQEAPNMGVLALLPEAEKAALPLLQALFCAQHVPLRGAIFPALVSAAGFITAGVWLLRLDAWPPAFIVEERDDAAESLGDRVSTYVEAQLAPFSGKQGKPILFMLFDAMIPNIASILDTLYMRLSDRVHYAGVNAGSESFQPMPCLFDNDRCVGNGLLGLLLSEEAAFALQHAYNVPEQVVVATSSRSNCISCIDWRPAFDVYQELIASKYGIALNHDNFYHYAVHFPFGILRANGEVAVRIPVGLTADGAIYCVGEVPENAMLALLQAPELADSQCVERLVATLGADAGVPAAKPLLTFYCAGRRMHLGASASQELAQLQTLSRASLLAGALSLGEIGAQESGYPTFHNAALVCRSWTKA